MRIVKSIVDSNYILRGFNMCDTQMGEQRYINVTIDELAKNNFCNNQISASGNGIVENGTFKINSLPMCMIKDNKIVNVTNEIEILKKFEQDESIIGFEVRLGKYEIKKLRYDDVVRISKWIKPVNFMVRMSATKTYFISGKPGVIKLEEISTIRLADKKSSSSSNKKAIIDVLELITDVSKLNGLIVDLNSVSGIAGKVQNFEYINLGDFAYPNISFNNTKINSTMVFRKPGIVKIELSNNASTSMQSYITVNKKLVDNGNLAYSKLWVAVQSEVSKEFENKYSGIISECTADNTVFAQCISNQTGKNQLKIYKVELNKIQFISKDRLNSFLLKPIQIKELLNYDYEYKLINKFLSNKTGFIANLQKKAGIRVEQAKNIGLNSMFNGMSPEMIKQATKAGIDVYSGMFKKMPEEKDRGEKDLKIDTSASIEYKLDGQDYKKITYSKIIEMSQNNSKELPFSVINIVNSLGKITNIDNALVDASNMFLENEKIINKTKEKLWLHKYSMMINGNFEYMHKQDSLNWRPDISSRRSKAEVFRCTAPGCTDLTVALLNVTI